MTKEFFVLENTRYFTINSFKNLNDRLIVGFSTRKNGYSIKPYDSLNVGLHVEDTYKTVIQNRTLLADDLQMPLHHWIIAEQVHGNLIKKVTKNDRGLGSIKKEDAIPNADGLYTKDKDVLLASLYADCVPLYFYSKNVQIVGLAHAGWKGTVGNIGPNMINCWVNNENVKIEDIYVAIGPSISQERYEVDDYVIKKVNEVIPFPEDLPYVKLQENKYLLDLKQLNKQLLIKAGVKEDQIFVSNHCTNKEEQFFYSYRRNQQTGRMMSFIGIRG